MINNQIVQLVVIADENNGIGKDNQLLAKMPGDLKHFKEVTIGFPVIMGRKTFESIDNKPLPGRKNIIITRQSISFPGCETAHSIEEALEIVKDEQKISIVGGAEIYKQSFDLANTIQLTRIHHTFEADAFFPDIKNSGWKEIFTEFHEADARNPYAYTFITLGK